MERISGIDPLIIHANTARVSFTHDQTYRVLSRVGLEGIEGGAIETLGGLESNDAT